MLEKKSHYFKGEPERDTLDIDDFTTSYYSYISPFSIFVFRFIVMGIFIWTMIDMPILYGNLPLATFTLWNWILIGSYFSLVLCLSFRKLELVSFAKLDKFLVTVTRIVFEVAFPGSVYVTLLVWPILLPVSYTIDREDSFLNRPSYFTHGANFVFMFLEVLITKLYIRKSSFLWFIVWCNTFGVFHLFLMLVRDIRPNSKPCPSYPFLSTASPTLVPFLILFTILAFLLFGLAYKMASFKLKWRFSENESEDIKEETVQSTRGPDL